MSKSAQGNKHAAGCSRSLEHREAIRKSRVGDKNPTKRLEVREKISKTLKDRRKISIELPT